MFLLSVRDPIYTCALYSAQFRELTQTVGTIQTTLRQSVARNAAGHPKNATEVADDNSGAQSATRVVISSEKQDGSHTGDPMTA